MGHLLILDKYIIHTLYVLGKVSACQQVMAKWGIRWGAHWKGKLMAISAEERARRQSIVNAARHSSEMDGGHSSDEARADQDAYIAGELTLDELLARVRERHE